MDVKEYLLRFLYVIRAAIVLSLLTTPIKEGQPREVILTRFDDPVTTRRFDFNIREVD